MGEGPKTDSERIAAMCLLLPDDPAEAVKVATVTCAAVILTAHVSDEAAVEALQLALTAMRDGGYGEATH